jgi:N-acetyl sugar amidotransferase
LDDRPFHDATPEIRFNMKICTRCIYDDNVGGISFDEEGICSYCRLIEQLEEEYATGTPEGERRMFEIVEQIKREGRGKEFDCVVGVSGGTDSSFMIAKAVEWDLRPLAVHYDNTWNTRIATQNIQRVLGKLGVPLHTHVVDNREIDDIMRSFFLAGVPEIDGPTDIALAETLYRAASKVGVRYVLEGHSFRAEGVSPLGVNYVDGGYIADVHRRFGRLPMRTFPNMTFSSFMKWIFLKRIKKIRPLWYIDYSKADAQSYLEEEFGWEYYGGHHLENRATAFNHSIYFPQKFGVDQRNNSLSAAVRIGLMSREAALEEYRQPPRAEEGLVEYFITRLGLTPEAFDSIMAEEPRSFREFRTYKERFERMRPIFAAASRVHLVPRSFYLKYCFPLAAEPARQRIDPPTRQFRGSA